MIQRGTETLLGLRITSKSKTILRSIYSCYSNSLLLYRISEAHIYFTWCEGFCESKSMPGSIGKFFGYQRQ